MSSPRPLPAAAATLALALSSALHAAEPRIEAGQTLADALRLLSARHRLPTVFSAQRVPPELRVLQTPTARDPRLLRDELLAQHGLQCREVHARCVVDARLEQPQGAGGNRHEQPASQVAHLAQVEVSPSHYSLMGEGANFLSADDIAATPHLADDLFRLARSIPGVAGGDIGAPFHVRGGQSDEIALRLDGMELYRPFHLHNLMNALGIVDSNLIGGVDVYTGAWPSRFGGRMSAVLDVHSREVGAGRERRIGVSAINAFLTHAQGDDEGRHSLLASARRGYLDVVLKFVDPDGEINPGYYDAFARYRFQPNESHVLSWQLLQAGDDIVFEGNRGDQRSEGRADASYLWMRWQASWSERLSSEALLGYTRLDQRRRGFAFDAFESNATVSDARELQGLRLSQRFDWTWSDRQRLEWGGEWRTETTDYDYFADVERYPLFSREPERFVRALQREVDGEQAAVWMDIESALGQRWLLRGGARYSRYAPDARSDDSLDPHLALSFSPDVGRTLRFGIGRASQPQRSDELAVEDGELDFHAPERATLAVLGWEQPLGPSLTLRAEVFHKRWDRLRPRYENLFEPIELFPETEGDRLRVSPADATSRGLELGLDGRLDGGRWWARYVYSRSRERIDGRWQPRRWDQPHALHLGWDRRFGDGWRLTAQVDVHSGWPTTAVSVAPGADAGIEVRYGERNAERFDPYINVAARLSRERRIGDGSLTWYVEIFNLLDRENADQVEQFTLVRASDGSLQVQRELGGGLPILPSFGVVWKF